MYCRACFANLPDSADTCRKCGRDPRSAPEAPHGAAPSAAPHRAAPSATPLPAAVDAVPSGPRWLKAAGLGLAAAAALSIALVLAGPKPERAAPPARPAPTDAVLAVAVDLAPVPVSEGVDEASLGAAAPLYRGAVEAQRKGERDRAVALMREAVEAAPGHEAVEAGLTAALEDAAATRLRAGAFAEAETLLAEVVERDGSRGDAWKALGFAQLRQDRSVEARTSLAQAALLMPDDAQAHLLYGTALYRTGDTPAALTELRAGRAAAADDPAFPDFLAKVEREAQAERGHSKAESRHFTVGFEGGGTSAQAGYLVSLLLEDAYHQVGRTLDYYPAEPVHAVLYPAEQFRDVTRSPAWAGAVFDGKIRLPVGGLTDRTEALSRTIAHEYTHALVHRLAKGRAPVWLNEGLAQLSEGPFDARTREGLRQYLRGGGRLRSLRALEGSFTGLDAAQAQLAYAQSLAATDFLVTRYGPSTSRRLLDRLGEGAVLSAAIEDLLYVRYEDFERQWVESYR